MVIMRGNGRQGQGCRLMVLAHPRPALQPPTALRKSPAPLPLPPAPWRLNIGSPLTLAFRSTDDSC